jgi:hypothetical protein
MRRCTRDCSKKVNHEMPPERFFVVTRGERTRTFVSAAHDTQEMPAKSRQKVSRQKPL